MRKRNLPENESAKRVQREKDPIPWRYCLLTLVFGVLLVGGFFFAARQHFSAIDYGIRNAELRKQRNDLESAQRRLTLAKEKALSYEDLEKTAQQIGLVKLGSQAVEIVSDVKESVQKTFLPKNRESKSKVDVEKKKDSDKSTDKNDSKSSKKSDKDNDDKDDKKSDKETKTSKSFSKTGN